MLYSLTGQSIRRVTWLWMALVVVLLAGLSVAQQPGRADSSLAAAQSLVQRLAGLSDADLLRRYAAEASERRLYLRPFDVDISSCLRAWESSGGEAYREQAVRCLGAALEPWMQRSAQELAALVTDRGSRDVINLDLRDACLHFAQLWRLTGDVHHLQRASGLLEAFARVVPKWPVWNPYYEKPAARRAMSQSDPEAFRGEFSAGLWGEWIYMDLILAQPLVQAWRLVTEGGESAPNSESMKGLFDAFLRAQRARGLTPDYSNMDAFVIRGKLSFGLLLPDPDLVHDGVKHLQNLYRVGFFPDGWWCEGAFSYHSDLQRGLRSLVEDFPAEYSDPPGFRSAVSGSRFDRLVLRDLVSGPSERADEVIRRLRLPDGRGLATHDSDWRDRSWLAPAENSSRSHLFGALGQATLVTGAGPNETRATLHYSPSSIHHHRDTLNFHLWAKGREVVSETNYRPLDGSDSTREWQASTPAHATVVIDGRDQTHVGPYARHVRDPRPEDQIPGVADWRYRWGQLQAADDYSELRLFNSDFPEVQVVEVEATKAYSAVVPTRRYRRTLALIRIDERDAYVVDIFRVQGGSCHDYLLHSCLESEASLRVSPRVTEAGASEPPLGLIAQFRSGMTSDLWLAEFDMGDETKLYTLFPGKSETEVLVGSAPAMRRQGHAPFLIARRRAGSSTFVAVHHVTQGGPSRVRSVDLVDCDQPGAVACRVELNGRTDLILSAEQNDREVVVGQEAKFEGSFAHLALDHQVGPVWAYLIDGSQLRWRGLSIEGQLSQQGLVTGIDRKEVGARRNAFKIDQPLRGLLPFGATVLIDPPGLPRWAYRISQVVEDGGDSSMELDDEPGLMMDQDHVRQVYFPNWAGQGVVRFRVPGRGLLLRDNQGDWSYAGSGAAKATAPGL